MTPSAQIKPQEVFDLFLLQYGAEDVRKFFGGRPVSGEQIASMKEFAKRRQRFREFAAKAERRRGRLAARARKRAARRESVGLPA